MYSKQHVIQASYLRLCVVGLLNNQNTKPIGCANTNVDGRRHRRKSQGWTGVVFYSTRKLRGYK